MAIPAELLAEIQARGPIPFARYMELCLYHPRFGYYRTEREKFGVRGDFYTSAQVQPAFARLLVRRWKAMWEALGAGEFTLVEIGTGRGDLANEAREWVARAHPEFHRALRYVPVEYGDSLPRGIRGCVFSNEFFDSQPAHAVTVRGGRLRERYVAERGGALAWHEGDLSSPQIERWLARLGMELAEGQALELSLAAADWMRRFAESLGRGYVLTFDYGYRAREIARLPAGTLMTYHHHQAADQVFETPGERDITAHVNFDLLIEAGRDAGLRDARLTTQSRYLMDLGEPDEFAEVFVDEPDRVKAMLLLKNLLFGLGETILVLEQEKIHHQDTKTQSYTK